MNPKTIKSIIYLGLFFVVSGISYLIFNKFLPQASTVQEVSPTITANPTSSKPGIIDFVGPKTEACLINGDLFTVEEKNAWSIRRPIGVMIENHLDSRPQSGLQNADIVYEVVAEGGITRFMGIFYCNAVKGSSNKYDVGPVRSARTYFLDLVSEYADYPLYAHVGGATCSPAVPGGPCTTAKKALALEQIDQYGWTNKGTAGDLNEFSLSYKVCRREPDRTSQVRDTEHTMYCSTSELWNVAANRGLTNLTQIKKISWDKNFRPWIFKQKDSPVSDASSSPISFDFWAGHKDYSVTWNYDRVTNRYLRTNGDQKHIDFNTSETLFTKNIVIQFVKETRGLDEHGHLLFDTIGNGKGILFQNGRKLDITWSKPSRLSRTIFKDQKGAEVNFVPGMIWIEILPIGNTVNYEGQS